MGLSIVLFLGGAMPLWAEFQINSFTTSNQDFPMISHDSAGGFVVAWASETQDGSLYGIFGQRFGSSGSKVGGEFQVNSFTLNFQTKPAISHDSAGGFVVAWQSYTQDGSSDGVFGQRFNSSGSKVGGEFQVNSFTTSIQHFPAISHDFAGGFVVAWQSNNQDGPSDGIFGQRFNSSGSKVGGEFPVNSFTSNRQDAPAISHDSAGDFVVAWESNTQDGSLYGVFGEFFVGRRLVTGPAAAGASRVRVFR